MPVNMRVDPAITRLLSLDPSKTTESNYRGGGTSSVSTSKIITVLPDGTERLFFLKTGIGSAAETMFRGEHSSLHAIHEVVSMLCPKSYGYGRLETDTTKFFLVTDFLHLHTRRDGQGTSRSGMSLAAKMAKLHTAAAPIPDGHDRPTFGFPETTCCGDTPQSNGYRQSWADFFRENRMMFVLRQGEEKFGVDGELRAKVKEICETVVPKLIADEHLNGGKGVLPVVCHGDLWSGNAGRGSVGVVGGNVEDLVFDPSAVYGHSEYDLGIMQMFGGFSDFFTEYHELCPKTEPQDEYHDRVKLYELYHHLNHYALFGGGYRSGAVGIMQHLIHKYADEDL